MNSGVPRKVIKFGNSSFIVSLPISWIKDNKLDKGDFVYISRNGSAELIILPSRNPKNGMNEKSIDINIDNKDFENLKREINFAYINNFDAINLRGKSLKAKIKNIKKLSDFFIGLSTLTRVNGEVVLKDVIGHEKLPPRDVINRISVLLNGMFSSLKDAIKNKSFQKEYNEIKLSDVEVNRNYFLVWKLTKKIKDSHEDENGSDPHYYWWLAMNQEYIGDELKRIARDLTRMEFKNEEYQKIGRVIEALQENYNKTFSSLGSRENESVAKHIKTFRTFLKNLDEIRGNSSNLLLDGLFDRFSTISRHIHYVTKLSSY